jgi:hypothetical protein
MFGETACADVQRVWLPHYDGPDSVEKDEGGFKVGSYDPRISTATEPDLNWNTFMGSTLTDKGWGIAVDGSGNVYVAGESKETWGLPVDAHGGFVDAFVVKLNSSGERQWNTFMGASAYDLARRIAVDGSGNVYVSGVSKATWGSPVNPYAGGLDAFVVKLNSRGERQWNTFMGASTTDEGWGIAVDGSGNVYVSGVSKATWGSPVNPFAGRQDVFVVKLNSSGERLWHTFMGSPDWAMWPFIGVDGSGNVYVSGWSAETWGTPLNPHGGSRDVFVVKLNSSGVLQWHTFIGGSGREESLGLTVDRHGSVYVSGVTGKTWGTPVNPYAGAYEAFAAKLDSSGAQQWHTFMGSPSHDAGRGITVDGSGNVYVTGWSLRTWGSPENAHSGIEEDAFAVILNPDGIRLWHTFMGASGGDLGQDIAVDTSGHVYIAGISEATWGSPVNPYSGGMSDAFAAKINVSHIVKVVFADGFESSE